MIDTTLPTQLMVFYTRLNNPASPELPEGADIVIKAADALEEWERSFELYWDAARRATERWRKANPGNDLVLPDMADLIVWLIERIDELTAANEMRSKRIDWTVQDNAEKAIQIASLDAEVDRLTAERDELRAALELLCDELEMSLPDDPQEFTAENIWRAHRKARAALKGKSDGDAE